MSFIRQLWRGKEGATSIEYAMILALVTVISIPSFEAFGSNLSLVMQKVVYGQCKAEAVCVVSEPH